MRRRGLADWIGYSIRSFNYTGLGSYLGLGSFLCIETAPLDNLGIVK